MKYMKSSIHSLCSRHLPAVALLLIVALSASSCEDEIQVDLRTADPQLVIEGVIREGTTAEVLITQTKAFSDNTEYPPVANAIVTISDDAGNNEQLTYDASGKYIATTIEGVQRRTYQLTVQHDGQTYTATTRMPPAVSLDSLTLFKFPMVDYWDPMIHFRDPVGEENQYYRFIIGINGKYPRFRERIITTEQMDGNVIHQPLFVRYEEESIEEDPIKKGDLITVEMRCLDRGTYKFFETLSRVEDSLANPTSNIKGGALGYFGAYSYTQMDIVAEWED